MLSAGFIQGKVVLMKISNVPDCMSPDFSYSFPSGLRIQIKAFFDLMT